VLVESFIVKIKRAETPFYAGLKKLGKAFLTLQLPIPRALDPIYVLILRPQLVALIQGLDCAVSAGLDGDGVLIASGIAQRAAG
jgi:hypothetical protein